MNSFKKLTVPALAVIGIGLLSACAGPVNMSSKHAAATRSNQMVQAVNPSAGNKPTPMIGLDGQKAEQVIKAYREEKGKAETVRLITGVVQ